MRSPGGSPVDVGEILEIVRGLHSPGILKALSTIDLRGSSGRARVDVLAVWKRFPPGVKTYERELRGADLFILAVDRRLFERDVREGFLGEVVAGRLLAPYRGLLGVDYLWRWEVLFKRRKVTEALTSLALEYPQLSSEILIEPRYFLFENLRRMTRIYPPISSIYQGFMGERSGEAVEAAMRGYREAMRELVEEGCIHLKDGYVTLDRGFVEKALRRRFRAISFLRMVERALRSYLIRGFQGVVELLDFSLEMAGQLGKELIGERDRVRMEDPKRFLHLPTTLGTISLTERTGIEDFIRRVKPLGEVSEFRMERSGGVLNEVYVLYFRRNGGEERALVKKYQNWIGFKWFPLALWTLGTQDFAVLGRSRLEREYTINSLLHRERYPVPSIYHVNLNRRLLIREFIEGESLVETVKEVLSRGVEGGSGWQLRRLGEIIAGVHGLGVSIGDSKPENFIASPGGEIYLIDLEQGAHKGNRAWDLAEFLYYSGHYASLLTDLDHVADLARAFIEGYLKGGGEVGVVEDVAGLQYTRVFSLFTLPQVIYTISKTCREAVRR